MGRGAVHRRHGITAGYNPPGSATPRPATVRAVASIPTPAVSVGSDPADDYDALVLAAGPVMYLTLADTSAGLTDQTGHGHDATAHGSPGTGTGIGDGAGAIVFDSSGTQYLEVPDHNALSVTQTGVLAIECWIAPSTLEFTHEQDPDTAPYVYFAGKAGSGQNEWQSRIYSYTTGSLNRPNRISVYVNNLAGGLGAGSYFQEPVVVDEWIHYVGIIDSRPTTAISDGSQGYTRIYRNGTLVHTNPIHPWDITPGNGTAPVRIGTSALGSFFEGRVAKFALWDREPTAAEIGARYEAATGSPPFPPTGSGSWVQHLDGAHASSSGSTLLLTVPGTASGRPTSREDVPAGLKIDPSTLVAPTLPISGMTGSGTERIITASGTYEGYDFPGALTINADNVTIRNCRWVDSADFWAVASEGRVGTIIEDCEFDGTPNAVTGWNYTARRCKFINLHDDPFHVGSASGTGSPTVIEDCLAYDFRPGPGAHVDGVQQWVSGIDNLYIRRNWFETRAAAGWTPPDEDSGFTSPVFLQSYPEAGTQGITLVEDNVLLSDDYYAIRFEGPDDSHGAITCRPIALRNVIDSNPGLPPIEGGVPFEGQDNIRPDGTPYNDPAQIPPGSGIPTEGGSGIVVPVGHTVIVQVAADYTVGAPSATDSQGNTYTVNRTSADTGHTLRVTILSARVTTALSGGDTITVTTGTTTRRVAVADEFDGMLLPITVDRNNGRAGTSTIPSVTVTTTNPDDLLVAAVGTAGPSTDGYTDDSLWTGLTPEGTSGSGSSDRTLHAAWKSVAATGAYTYAPTLGTSRTWVAAFVAYEGSG